MALREMHSLIAENLKGAKSSIASRPDWYHTWKGSG